MPRFIRFMICWAGGLVVFKLLLFDFIKSAGASIADMSLLAFLSVLVWTVASLIVSMTK